MLDISVRIAATFRDADDSVVTHRDVEPWNVLIGARGPLLIDWDTADPDSASLELAEVATALAYRGRTERDPVAVTRTLASHAHHGDRSPEALERRRGSRLSRLGEQLGKSLGWLELGFADPLQVRRRAGNSWRTFPRASAGCAIWTRSLTLS